MSSSRTWNAEATSSSLLHFLCLERAHAQFEESRLSHQRALARAAAAAVAGGGDGDDQGHPRSISQIRRANTNYSMVGGGGGGDGNDEETAGVPAQQQQQQSQGGGTIWESDAAAAVVAPTSIRRLAPAAAKSSGAFAILVCSWKSADGMIEGQHHIRGLPIRPIIMKKEYPSSSGSTSTIPSPSCPIVITGTHPSVVLNRFARGPAQVPLTVTLRNRLVSPDPVRFEFSMNDAAASLTTTSKGSALSSHHNHHRLDWTGPECLFYSLRGGQSLQILLQANIPAAGVYNLQSVRITILNTTTSSTSSTPLEEGPSSSLRSPTSSPQPPTAPITAAAPVSYRFPWQWNVTVREEEEATAVVGAD